MESTERVEDKFNQGQNRTQKFGTSWPSYSPTRRNKNEINCFRMAEQPKSCLKTQKRTVALPVNG